MKKIEVGSKVQGVWGAMIARSEGTIKSITGSLVKIDWDDEEGVHLMDIKDLHKKGWRSINGSGIGVFVV